MVYIPWYMYIPWMPCYISGNAHPTLELLQIPARGEATEAGSMSSTSGCGAVGGGHPSKVTVEEAEQKRRERLTEARKRAVQTMKRRKEERCAREAAGDKDAVGDE
jgi:hypothetical protein